MNTAVQRNHNVMMTLNDYIVSCFHWYKKCKNPPGNAEIIVKNKMARFMDHGVGLCCI